MQVRFLLMKKQNLLNCMDLEKENPSFAQNVAGEHHKVVGGNIFYGPAHITIHGDTTSKKEEENAAAR